MSPVICLSLVFLIAGTTADVTLVTSDSVVRMPKRSGSMRLIYRNVSERILRDLQVAVRSETPVDIEVRPERIPRCLPADRCVFEIVARRIDQTPELRFPVTVKLVGANLPELHNLRLIVDASPRAAERGWIAAGQIEVGTRGKTTSILVLAVVFVVPLALLIGLALYLKRKKRKESGPA